MQSNKSILFFDVDTQIDFIEKNGALYVPGAETLKPRFKQLVSYARLKGIPVWGSVDAHGIEDPELIRNNGPFPDHCMRGSAGQRKIAETAPLNPVSSWIENRVYSPAELAQIKQHSTEIYFLKQTYDMFDNPNLKILAADYDPIVVFGVATDYCISAAVLGFRNLQKTVYLVTDAIKAVNPDNGRQALENMRQAGAVFINADDVLNSALLK